MNRSIRRALLRAAYPLLILPLLSSCSALDSAEPPESALLSPADRQIHSPRVLLREPHLGVFVVTHEFVQDFVIAENQPLALSWVGDAGDYGDEVEGYRFGWDIVDPDDDGQWSDWSPEHLASGAVFEDGDHSFRMECRDLQGNVTRATLLFEVIPFSMDRPLLFVDDYDNSASENSGQAWPEGPVYTWGTFWHTDAQMKAFWDDILGRYAGYDPVVDFFRPSVVQPQLPVELLAQYRRVIWEVREAAPGESALARVARFCDPFVAPVQPYDYLSAFLARGGQMLLCGSRPLQAMLPVSGQMGDGSYERKLPFAFAQHLSWSSGSEQQEKEAIGRFLPLRFFGLDAVTLAADANPRQIAAADVDFKTGRTFWGATGFAWDGESADVFGDGAGWAAGDTLRLKPEVYAWFEDAGPVFLDPDSYDDPDGLVHEEFGLADVEIYNWGWLAGALEEPLHYRESEYLRLLDYVPADPTTRWGAEPSSEHVFLRPDGSHYDEKQYSLSGETRHGVGVIGGWDGDSPQVLLGFVPYYLDDPVARDLVDHLCLDVLGMAMD